MIVAALPPKEFIDLIGGGDFAEFDLVVEKCEVTSTDHILDIGSGCGRVAIPFTEYLTTGKYDGFDVVLPMVEWCSQNITAKYPHFNFQHASLKNTKYSNRDDVASCYVFPFENDTVDIVFATSVFTHLVTGSARQYAKEIASGSTLT
ncbi:MAG: class I SAM-dependent methyltransferase, partial [Hyphomicrobiales bacterium]